jgi:hypothetical protein
MNSTKQEWPKTIHLEKWSTGFSAHTQRAAHRTTYIRADLIKPIQAEPVGEVEDAEDSIVTWFVEPTNGMLLYTHPAPVNVLTDELKVELRGIAERLRKVPFIEVPASADTEINNIVIDLDVAIDKLNALEGK